MGFDFTKAQIQEDNDVIDITILLKEWGDRLLKTLLIYNNNKIGMNDSGKLESFVRYNDHQEFCIYLPFYWNMLSLWFVYNTTHNKMDVEFNINGLYYGFFSPQTFYIENLYNQIYKPIKEVFPSSNLIFKFSSENLIFLKYNNPLNHNELQTFLNDFTFIYNYSGTCDLKIDTNIDNISKNILQKWYNKIIMKN